MTNLLHVFYERTCRSSCRTRFSGKKTQLGVKMSKTVKKVGAFLTSKTIIEADKVLFKDYEILSELTTYLKT